MRHTNFIILFSLSIVTTLMASGQLQKVLILSRHGLRTPLTSSLVRMTPKEWPKWTQDVGQLTKKGAVLESYMGKYFGEWLNKEGLIKSCPDEEKVHIFANTRARTKATAEAFVKTAFPNCNIKVHAKKSAEMDPVFNPIVRSDSQTYTDKIKAEMEKKINEVDLEKAYKILNILTDIKNSKICLEDKFCDLSSDVNEIIFEKGKEPNMTGPLFIGCSVADSFLMSYYEDKPKEDIAWGQIEDYGQWKEISKLIKQNLNVRFNTSAARDICNLLLKYMEEKMNKDEEIFTLLVGHDSNIFSVLSALDFDEYELPEQLEYTPVGGKVVFQKWRINDEDFLKIEYVYQSLEQIRNAQPISLKNPPKNVTLTLKNCKYNENKFCRWQDFMSLLNDVILPTNKKR